MATKHLQLIRKTGFETAAAAKTALEAAFNGDTFKVGEPALGILNDGSVVLGIKGDATHGSVFYNAATVDAAILQAKNDLLGDATHYLTLGALEDAIDEISGNTASYSVSKTTTGLPAEVKERYNLTKTVGGNTITVGENIDIYKDSSIVSITYDDQTQELVYTYIDASGDTQTTRVDMSELVLEAEFASGVTVTNHVAHGVVDPASEGFLTVGAAGFKVSGVADAISAAVNALDATESGNSTHVSVKVVEANGVITGVEVGENNIASHDALTAETAARKAQIGIDGDTFVADATGNYISGATSLMNADKLLDTQVKQNADDIAAIQAAQISIALSANTETQNYLTLDHTGTVYTLALDGIANKIQTEIEKLNVDDTAVASQFVTAVSEADGKITVSRAQATASDIAATAIASGATTVAITGTTVAAQIASVGETMKSMQDGAYDQVEAGDGINVTAKANNKQTVSVKLASGGVTGDMLGFTANGELEVKDSWDCGTWS